MGQVAALHLKLSGSDCIYTNHCSMVRLANFVWFHFFSRVHVIFEVISTYKSWASVKLK